MPQGGARGQNLGHLKKSFFLLLFLAHLSRRLIGELIVYQWSVVVVRRRPSSVHNAQTFSSQKPLG